jgi:hypothetical protein
MRFFSLTTFGVAVAAVTLSSAVASAQTYRCDVIHDRTRVNAGSLTTTSTGFTSIAGTAVRVTQSTNNCLIVEFSAQINARSAIEFRLTRDGSPVGFPPVANVTTDARSDQRTIRFLVQPDAGNIGEHVYQIDFRSDNGEAASLSRIMTTVYYPD